MRVKCIVSGCPHYVGDKDIWFHTLAPIIKNKSRLREWCAVLKVPESYVKPRHSICCKHFDKTDFNKSDLLMREVLADKKFKSPALLATATPRHNLSNLGARKRRTPRVNKHKIDEAKMNPTLTAASCASGSSIRASEIVPSKNPSKIYLNDLVYEDPNDKTFCFSTSVITDVKVKEMVIVSDNSDEKLHTDVQTNSESNSFALVFIPNLLNLFKFCSVCGSKILNKKQSVEGSILSVHNECEKGHKNVWYSKPT